MIKKTLLSITVCFFVLGVMAQPTKKHTYQFNEENADSVFVSATSYVHDSNNNVVIEIVDVDTNTYVDSIKRIFDVGNRLIYEVRKNSNNDTSGYSEWIFDTINRTLFYTIYLFDGWNWRPDERLLCYGIKDFDHSLEIYHLGYVLYLCDSFATETYKPSLSAWSRDALGYVQYANGKVSSVVFPVSDGGYGTATASLTYDADDNISLMKINLDSYPGVDWVSISQEFDENGNITKAKRDQLLPDSKNNENIWTEYQYDNGCLASIVVHKKNSGFEWFLEHKEFYGGDSLSVQEYQQETFIVYPNPADCQFEFSAETEGLVQLFDLQGKKVLEQRSREGNNLVKVSHLAKGSYVVVLQENNKLKFSKLIVH